MNRILIPGLIILIAILLYSLAFSGKQCGGFAANINTCPVGYECVLNSQHPDASGTCRFSPIFILIELRNKYLK